MELLLVIAAVAAFVLLVKHTKAKGRIAELTLNLKARQNEIEDFEREVVPARRPTDAAPGAAALQADPGRRS